MVTDVSSTRICFAKLTLQKPIQGPIRAREWSEFIGADRAKAAKSNLCIELSRPLNMLEIEVRR